MDCSPSKTLPVTIAVAAMGLLTGAATADVTVISFGGNNQKAQAKAFYEPYAKATGSRVIPGEYDGEQVKINDLKPGDLVFFNTMRRAFSHVGIYLGNYQFVHAPSAGGVVRVEDMRVSYWAARYDGARRVLPSASARPTQAN